MDSRDERIAGRDEMTLRAALRLSRATAAVLLQQRVGSGPALRLVRDLGVSDQPDVPSLALGSGLLVCPAGADRGLRRLSNLGHVRPWGSCRCRTRMGRTSTVHIERERIIPDAIAFQMVSMLQDVIDRGHRRGARKYE